jgi:hypothetical protein
MDSNYCILNPGEDFYNIKKQCNSNNNCGSNYSINCMFTAQGEYICQLDWKTSIIKDTNLGYNYILNK